MMRFTFFNQEIDMSGIGRLELAARLSPLECLRENGLGSQERGGD
jgi:hypothetical protein